MGTVISIFLRGWEKLLFGQDVTRVVVIGNKALEGGDWELSNPI